MSALYDKGRQAFLEGSVHWLTDSIKATLVDTGTYTVNLTTQQYMNTNTVSSVSRIGTATALTGLTSYSGIADATDLTFTSVSGLSVEALIIWKDGGGSGTTVSGITDLLLAYIDTGTGLPFTPSGGDVIIQWDNGTNKIFKL
jgi:hypothetical protein